MGTGAQLAVEPRNVATLRRHGGCDPIAAPPIASPPSQPEERSPSKPLGGETVAAFARNMPSRSTPRMRIAGHVARSAPDSFANLADQ